MKLNSNQITITKLKLFLLKKVAQWVCQTKSTMPTKQQRSL